MTKSLIFEIFKREDFSEYLSWFQDSELNKRLGPLEEDDEWLTHVLKDQEGCTYSVFYETILVSVVGIVFPDRGYPTYCISNMAVKPSLRGKGLGTDILKLLLELYPLDAGQYWIAHVDIGNQKTKSFFENNGWEYHSDPIDNNNMYLFEYGR